MRIARVAWPDWQGTVEIRGEVAWPAPPVPWHGGEASLEAPRSLVGSRWLVPVVPTKILAVGRNFADHARELGNPVPTEPLWFLKPPSALLACGEEIVWPALSERVDYEGELAVVIGRKTRRVRSEEEALQSIFGFAAFNDVTARDLQRRDGQFTRGKGFDTFAPFGPWIETAFDWQDWALELSVNGELKQRGGPKEMLFSIPALIAAASQFMTLEPGDILVTGTPPGVGPLAEGDLVEVHVTGLGILSNRVVREND